MQSTFITVYIILSYEPLHTTNQLQWCGVFGERHEESHTAMSNTVVCPKYTTIGNPQSRFSNPRRACARGLYCHSVRRSFRLSVCLLPRFLGLRATRQQNSDTNGFVATLASFKKKRFSYNCCVRKLWREKQVKEPICKLALAYLGQLCVPWRHNNLQRRTGIDSRVLSSSVASL